MALTRKFLAALGIEADKIDEIITAHTESTDAIKAERDQYKKDADELSKVKEQLKTAQTDLEKLKKEDFEGKYNNEKAAHEKLKADIQSKETTSKKSTAFKALLKEKGYSDKALAKITQYGGYIDGLELDNDGKIKDADKLLESVKSDWDEYTPQATHVSHTPSVPDQQANGKSDGDTAKAMKNFGDKFYYEHYGVKPDNGNSATKEE